MWVRKSDCQLAALSWSLAALPGCSRATAASFFPKLDIQLTAQHAERALPLVREKAGWHVRVMALLRFQPRIAAQALPARAEFAPESWLAPCDADDPVCLEEAAELEPEMQNLLGELE